MEPVRIWRIAVAASLVAVSASTASATGPTIYAAANSGANATLYTLSSTTGEATAIGLIGFSDVHGLSFSPSNGNLYGTGYDTNLHLNLLTINTATGAGTSVGLLGISEVDDIAFRPSDGTLFAFSSDDCGCVYTINITTGAATPVDDSGGQGGQGNALAFSNGSILYSSANLDGPDYAFLEYVDQIEGTTNNLVQLNYDPIFGANPYSAAMKFDPQTGTLWALVTGSCDCDSPPSYLAIIDSTTGNVASVGLTASEMSGIAIPGSAPAAPATPVIYGSAYSGASGPATLYRISPATGTATAIGPIGADRVGALSLAPNGVLYGVGQVSVDDEGSQWVLLTINPLTGAGTQVGQLGIPSGDSVFDIAARPSDGTLFAYLDADGSNLIFTINTATGAATRIGATTQSHDGNGLAFSLASPFLLYTANDTDIETVNQATGLATSDFLLNYIPELGSSEFEYRANGMKFDRSGTLWASVVNGGGEAPQTNYLATIALANGPDQGNVAPIGVSVTGLDALAIPLALAITNANLPAGTVGMAYALRLTSTGGVRPLTWSASNLPAGLALNANTGVISGNPTASGLLALSITLTDAAGETTVTPYNLSIAPALAIATAALPSGSAGRVYSALLAAIGGAPPYTWSVIGLPGGLALNASTGLISGTPIAAGGFSVSVTVTDSNNNMAAAFYELTIINPVPLLQIITGALPAGAILVSYAATIAATGGSGVYLFSLASGSLPAGLSLDSSGGIAGVPVTIGTFSFSVRVTDTANRSAASGFSIQIKPPPLSITTGSLGSVPVGTISQAFNATGGIPPYTWALAGGSAPAGLTISSGGVLAGSTTATGVFQFTVSVTDSTGTVALKSITLTVTPPPLAISGSGGNGQEGLPYTAQFSASGGQPPYTWSAVGIPAFLAFSNGSVSGTPPPGSAGAYEVTVTVIDSAGKTAGVSFTLTISAAPLAVTGALPNGTVGTPYSGSVSASGGIPPYSFSASGLPPGISFSGTAASGSPSAPGNFGVRVTVTDSKGATASQTFALTIAIAPIVITGTSGTSSSGGTAGSGFTATLSASGGVGPYTWSFYGLPPGLSGSASGAISGTPTAPGTFTVTATVTDSTGATAVQTITITIALPPVPPLNITGGTVQPASQSNLQVALAATYPVPLTVNLTMTFTPSSGPDDPMAQFANGGRTAQITVPAGSTVGLSNVGIQTGTVAGTITITAQLLASNQDVTPTPAPAETIVISPSAPVLTGVTATSSSAGVTVTIMGYATDREVTQATFQFAAAASSTLQTSTFAISVAQAFAAWYQNPASAAFGSQFSLTLPFTVTGNPQDVASVTVTLVSNEGASQPVTANLP